LDHAYATALNGEMPQLLPLEMYCHTLSDPSILSDALNEKGFHTLTLFGLHTPAKLFDADPNAAKALAKERAIASLNQYLLDPIESVLAPCSNGSLAIEVKSPLDLEQEISLPRGNIFHRDLDFPFLDAESSNQQIWEQKRMIHIFILQVLERDAVVGLAASPVIMRRWLYFQKMKNKTIAILILISSNDVMYGRK